MKTLRTHAKRLLERLAGVEVEHLVGKSFFVIDTASKDEAWYSYRCVFKTLLRRYGFSHVLDVGANTGQFGRRLRSFYSGKISSFEPVSSAYADLVARIGTDGAWRAYNFALGAQAATRPINVSLSSDFSSLLKTNDFCIAKFGERTVGTRQEVITIRRLDETLAEIEPDSERQRLYLKMDTQGYDTEVFKGLGDRLKDVVALQSEISLIPIYENMPHWTESIALYERAGFGVAGMFPVSWDAGRVIEYDCILARI